MTNPQASGAKAFRTEVVTARFEPQQRFVLEILARYTGKTVSSLIDKAVSDSLDKHLSAAMGTEGQLLVDIINQHMWSPFEADRFVKTAYAMKMLLNYEQQILWQLILETDSFWHYTALEREGGFPAIPLDSERFNFSALRAEWDLLKQEAQTIVAGHPQEMTWSIPAGPLKALKQSAVKIDIRAKRKGDSK
jgi:hypothetical protein